MRLWPEAQSWQRNDWAIHKSLQECDLKAPAMLGFEKMLFSEQTRWKAPRQCHESLQLEERKRRRRDQRMMIAISRVGEDAVDLNARHPHLRTCVKPIRHLG